MENVFSIAIDGPAGAGKSTVAKMVAARMGAKYLDTGATYRTMGLYMKRLGLTSAEEIAAAAGKPRVEVVLDDSGQRMLLDGEDVTAQLSGETAGGLASLVAKVPAVRERMVALQRAIAKSRSIVMDGRDIGTVVLPDAPLKVFLTASAEERARRRHGDMPDTPYETILADIRRRDYEDAHREISPMRQADDAVLLDCTNMTKDEVADEITRMARERMKGGNV